MAIINLTANIIDNVTKEAIEVCKSNSGICGMKLRAAHMQLGKNVGILIAANEVKANFIAVIVMMRAGLPFALGISDGLEDANKDVSVIFSTKEKPLPGDFDPQQFNLILLTDAVIRTGKEMIALADSIGSGHISFATNVLDKVGIPNFDSRTVYTVRVSENSFVGTAQKTVSNAKGPDTGDRLFNSTFMKGNLL
ncbi:MAG: uracil phosphoribosyltransferase [Peptococcaceae bacterium]|nr:uracil phosphoribosyltransferase [Peptococcaceae bacterium]